MEKQEIENDPQGDEGADQEQTHLWGVSFWMSD